MQSTLRQYLLASLPVGLIGCWNLGDQLQRRAADSTNLWQLELFDSLGMPLATGDNPIAELALGASFVVPLLAALAATSRIWAELFARARRRCVDPGWFLSAWLFTLLLPATMPLPYAVIAFSFGVVFGCHVFGGTGRYIVSPVLLGLAFLAIAYPDLFADDRWLPGVDTLSSWALVANAGIETAVADAGSWTAHFLGSELGAIGSSSALAALLGAAYLLARKLAAARILAGALLGLLIAGSQFGDIAWHWHLAAGNFAFALAFIATDRSTQPSTNAGCWAFGALFGVLTVALRVANPHHPEASVAALLLATLCVPLLDYVAAGTGLDAQVSEAARDD